MHDTTDVQMNIFIDIIGWVGAVLVVSAYLLITTNKLKIASKLYQLMNLLGAAGIIVNSLSYGAYPSVAVNVVWIFIAFYGLEEGLWSKMAKKRRNKPRV